MYSGCVPQSHFEPHASQYHFEPRASQWNQCIIMYSAGFSRDKKAPDTPAGDGQNGLVRPRRPRIPRNRCAKDRMHKVEDKANNDADYDYELATHAHPCTIRSSYYIAFQINCISTNFRINETLFNLALGFFWVKFPKTWGKGNPVEDRIVDLSLNYQNKILPKKWSLSKQVIGMYDCKGTDLQAYGIGLKRWEKHIPGKVIHTIGWPLAFNTYGGGWEYHMADGLLVSLYKEGQMCGNNLAACNYLAEGWHGCGAVEVVRTMLPIAILVAPSAPSL
ncbi:hypothetical protein B0H13DRAFT_1919716 [Mycena leptocephala]|nr:hypothetical protein B0H13DRAFT_1919716 [Mycena leptocephala]